MSGFIELGVDSSWWGKFFAGEFPLVEGKRIRVACAGIKVCPRDPRFEYHLERGRNLIGPLLRGEKLGREHLDLVFPERWMNIHERRWLLEAILRHPEVKSADILMQDPLIAGSVPNGCLVVATPESGNTGLSTDDLEAIWPLRASADTRRGT